MDNSFIKKILWCAIIVGILYGIYAFLPEVPHAMVKSIIQPKIEKESVIKISEIQDMTNDTIGGTYKEILETNGSMPTWIYEKSNGTLPEKVIYYGGGYIVDLREVPNYEGSFYSGCPVKIEFTKNPNNKKEPLNIKIYLNGNKTPIDEKVNNEVLKYLKSGA